MTVDELRSVFSRWDATTLSAAGIEFNEAFPPPAKGDDYCVIYEVSFEPKRLDQGRIEFWLTDAGHVAVGIERYARITKRQGFKTWRGGFAVGHEPRTVSGEGLKILFDAVASGKFRLVIQSVFRVITWIGLDVYASDFEAMNQSGYDCSRWIAPISDGSPGWLRRVVEYQAW